MVNSTSSLSEVVFGIIVTLLVPPETTLSSLLTKPLLATFSEIKALREEFWKEVKVPGTANEFNEELAKAGRVADFLELGELFAKDALHREESCGGHFREDFVEESGEQKGEAKRDDENFAYVAAWEYKGQPSEAQLHKEQLEFNDIELKQRSYK